MIRAKHHALCSHASALASFVVSGLLRTGSALATLTFDICAMAIAVCNICWGPSRKRSREKA